MEPIESYDEILGPVVDIKGIENEKDINKVNSLAFDLFQEASRSVMGAAHLLDEEAKKKGGWARIKQSAVAC